MTHKEKKEIAEKQMKQGDKRSYNEIMADIELEIWTERHKGQKWMDENVRIKQKNTN